MAKKSSIEHSPLFKGILESLVESHAPKSSISKGQGMKLEFQKIPEEEDKHPTLVKSILNVLNGPHDSIERLAFESDPSLINQYASLYKAKLKLIPDHILKRILIQDDLVASIVQARSNHMSSFGRPRPDRFSKGFIVEPKAGTLDKLDAKGKEELQKRIDVAIEKFNTCGETKGWSDNEKMSLSTYLSMSTRNAVGVGRLATEVIWIETMDGKRKFHSFRPIDGGTIYKAAPQKEAAEKVREQAFHLLSQVKNKKLIPEKFQADEYSWVQVIEGKPVQAFTAEECLVHNFYPVPDVELDGYPVTPIDTMISAVTTHINITTHNKLYFQSGRASRGMLVIRSDEVNESVTARIRQQFNASINSVSNAWRMPVFGIGADDEINWVPIDNSSRDMEFQYLTDMNARVILSAFMMSPEELPGWSYLSRGTNNQALSESNNEYKMEAARDLGIRPLVSQFEDFLNTSIFPLIDPNLAKLCHIRLMGLDAETAEKESVRLQQDAPVHMTYDEILDKVEKDPVGKEFGGEFPLNPQYQAILDKYFTVGQILEKFFGVKGAAQDPSLAYMRDQFWFTFMQMQQAQQQMQAQAQQQAQQQAMGQQAPQGQGQPQDAAQGQPGASGYDSQPAPRNAAFGQEVKTEGQKTEESQSDLTRSLDQVIDLLSKSEDQLPPSKRRLLAQQKKTVKNFLDGWQQDVRTATKEILAVAEQHNPKKKT